MNGLLGGVTVFLRVGGIDVDVDWRGFGGRNLIPTHRKIP
jgi:hypothetical protein